MEERRNIGLYMEVRSSISKTFKRCPSLVLYETFVWFLSESRSNNSFRVFRNLKPRDWQHHSSFLKGDFNYNKTDWIFSTRRNTWSVLTVISVNKPSFRGQPKRISLQEATKCFSVRHICFKSCKLFADNSAMTRNSNAV